MADQVDRAYVRHLRLTFESGYAYPVAHDRVDPASLMDVVDTVTGLLDRMPDVHPRLPDSTATPTET